MPMLLKMKQRPAPQAGPVDAPELRPLRRGMILAPGEPA